MSVSDASNLGIAVLTALGVIIALFTFRRSLAGRAKLDMSLGREILLHYTKDRELILTADFSFINTGALPGFATEISAIIYETDRANPAKRLVWLLYEVSTVTGRNPGNGSTQRWTRSDEQVGPLIVPGRTSGSSGVTRRVRLYEENAHAGRPLSDETYKTEFTVRATACNKETYQYKYRLVIAPGDAANLETYCAEKGGRWDNRLVLRQQPRTDGDKREVKRDGLLYTSRGLLRPIIKAQEPTAHQMIT
jgi:hypothetical protein